MNQGWSICFRHFVTQGQIVSVTFLGMHQNRRGKKASQHRKLLALETDFILFCLENNEIKGGGALIIAPCMIDITTTIKHCYYYYHKLSLIKYLL